MKTAKKSLSEGYNSMSDAGRSLAARAKRRFHKDYPEVRVGIDTREGWITVDGKKAVNLSQASGRPMSLEDVVEKMILSVTSSGFGEPRPGQRPGEQELDFGKDIGTYNYTSEGKVKITKRQLRQLIKEYSYGGNHENRLVEYEQYVDEDGNVYDDEGNVERRGKSFGNRYGGQTYTGTRQPWRDSYRPSRTRSKKGNPKQEAALEDALKVKTNNFLQSILDQLKQGRTLSTKQKSIVRKILAKVSPESVTLFEAESKKEPVDTTWMKIINEYYENELHPDHIDGQPWSGTLEDFANVQSKTFGGGELAQPEQHQKLIDTGREMAKASTKKETSGK